MIYIFYIRISARELTRAGLYKDGVFYFSDSIHLIFLVLLHEQQRIHVGSQIPSLVYRHWLCLAMNMALDRTQIAVREMLAILVDSCILLIASIPEILATHWQEVGIVERFVAAVVELSGRLNRLEAIANVLVFSPLFSCCSLFDEIVVQMGIA